MRRNAPALKERNNYFGLSGLDHYFAVLTRGDVPTSRDLPLAVIFRAVGAATLLTFRTQFRRDEFFQRHVPVAQIRKADGAR